MRLLKFFLWITLLTCISWGTVIFLGPTLIDRAVNAYFGDAVKIQRLDVSPALEVSAAAVEFDFPGHDGAPSVRGVSRGVSLGWTFEELIELELKLGPTRVEGLGFLSSGGLKLMPNSNFDWSLVGLKGQFEAVGGGPHQAEVVNLSADLDVVTQFASDIQVDAERINAELNGLRAQIPAAAITLSDMGIATPIAEQASDFEVQFLEGFSYAGTLLKSAEVRGQLQSGLINFEVSGFDLVLSDLGVVIDRLNASTTYDVIRQDFEPNTDFGFENITMQDLDGSIARYAGNITVRGGTISHAGSGTINTLALKSGENYIGEVSDANFQLELSGTTDDATRTTLRAAAEIALAQDFDLAVAVDAVADATAPTECLGGGCVLSDVVVNFVASVPGGRLVGSSSCPYPSCAFDRFRHTFQTDDTDKFFAGVGAARVFSPLAVPLAYAAMKRGAQNGNGHRLDF